MREIWKRSARNKRHAAEPFHYPETPAGARQRLINLLRAQKRVRIVDLQGNYIHAEFTSTLFRFVDDMEFLFDDAAKVIHIRSASRVGWSDLGVNRRHVEMLRSRFEKINTTAPHMQQDIR
jgi:uncharacterized protein (DUF1499 family)